MAASADLLIRLRAQNDASATLNAVKGQVTGLNGAMAAGGAAGGTAFKQAALSAEQLGQKLNNAWQAGLLLAGVGAAIGTGLVAAVKTGADFESQMSAVKSVLAPGEVAQFSGQLQELALQLGRATVFTPIQAGQGIEELAKAGVSVQNILGGTARAVLDLSSATGTDVPTAATLAANALNAFALSGSQAEHIADVLAGTANATAAQMQDLKFGIQQAGATAHAIGLSFEDTATAIGLFANAGLDGGVAGASLKEMLLRLQPANKAAAAEMQALGLATKDGGNVFFDAAGKVKSLADIAGTLQRALANLTPEEQTQALQTLFGIRGFQAGAILAGVGSSGVGATEASIGKISVSAQAAQRLDNLAGSVKQLVGSIQTVAVQVEAAIAPPLRAVIDLATRVVNAFSRVPSGVQIAAAGFIGLVGIVAALAGGFILLAPGILAALAALPALGVVLGGVAAVALPVIAVLAALAVGAYLVVTNWSQVRLIVAGALNAAGDAARVVIPIMLALLAPILAPIGALVLLGKAFFDNFENIKKWVSQAVTDILSWLSRLLTGISGALGPIATTIGNAVGGPAAQFAAAFQSGINQANSNLLGIPQGVDDALHGAAATVASSDPFSGLIDQAKQVAAAASNPLAAIGGVGRGVGPGVALPSTGSSLLDQENERLDTLKRNLGDAQDALAGVRETATGAASAVRPFSAEIDQVDKKIATIQLGQLEKSFARLEKRGPPRTPGQQLRELNLEKQILEHKQIIATPFNAGGGGATTDPRVKSAEDLVRQLTLQSHELERQIALTQELDKLGPTISPIADSAFPNRGDVNQPKVANLTPGTFGLPFGESTGAFATVSYPTLNQSTTTNVTTPAIGSITIERDVDYQKVLDVVNGWWDNVVAGGQGGGNTASSQLPGVSRRNVA